MIKFFRKIRQKLLTEHKFGKYFAYAFGEILLVVLGILIALQVNTWNQNRQRSELEKKILLEIHENLNVDILELEDDINGFQILIESDSILIHHFQSKYPYNDSIGAHIHIAQLSPHSVPFTSGYKLLESKGIEVISDDALRMLITHLYEWDIPYYGNYAEERFAIMGSIIQPYWAKNFYIEDYDKLYGKKRVPINYNSLLQDSEFISLLHTSKLQAEIMKEKSEILKDEIINVQKNIEKYLETSFGVSVQNKKK